jgi:D-lactate dehydrogenase
MTTVAFYDTKLYDRQFMVAAATDVIHWVFHEFRLTAETAATARGADAVCVFVNDRLDRACLEELAGCGIRHVALRCAGFNNVDLVAAGRCERRLKSAARGGRKVQRWGWVESTLG